MYQCRPFSVSLITACMSIVKDNYREKEATGLVNC